jgi:CpXC protein
MSTFYPFSLECSCGHIYTVDLAYGIHVTRLPQARQQILDGEFQVFQCPACGTATAVEGPTVYTDFIRHHYVAVETAVRPEWRMLRTRLDQVFENSFTLGPPIATEMGTRFKKRCVIGFQALREKLVIWDAALDDLVVEGVKGRLADRVGIRPGEGLFRLAGVLPGGHLTFLRFEPPPPAPPDTRAHRTTTAGPIDAETVIASEYLRQLEDRAGITTDYPWLADDWLVDIYDGLAVRSARR